MSGSYMGIGGVNTTVNRTGVARCVRFDATGCKDNCTLLIWNQSGIGVWGNAKLIVPQDGVAVSLTTSSTIGMSVVIASGSYFGIQSASVETGTNNSAAAAAVSPSALTSLRSTLVYVAAGYMVAHTLNISDGSGLGVTGLTATPYLTLRSVFMASCTNGNNTNVVVDGSSVLGVSGGGTLGRGSYFATLQSTVMIDWSNSIQLSLLVDRGSALGVTRIFGVSAVEEAVVYVAFASTINLIIDVCHSASIGISECRNVAGGSGAVLLNFSMVQRGQVTIDSGSVVGARDVVEMLMLSFANVIEWSCPYCEDVSLLVQGNGTIFGATSIALGLGANITYVVRMTWTYTNRSSLMVWDKGMVGIHNNSNWTLQIDSTHNTVAVECSFSDDFVLDLQRAGVIGITDSNLTISSPTSNVVSVSLLTSTRCTIMCLSASMIGIMSNSSVEFAGNGVVNVIFTNAVDTIITLKSNSGIGVADGSSLYDFAAASRSGQNAAIIIQCTRCINSALLITDHSYLGIGGVSTKVRTQRGVQITYSFLAAASILITEQSWIGLGDGATLTNITAASATVAFIPIVLVITHWSSAPPATTRVTFQVANGSIIGCSSCHVNVPSEVPFLRWQATLASLLITNGSVFGVTSNSDIQVNKGGVALHLFNSAHCVVLVDGNSTLGFAGPNIRASVGSGAAVAIRAKYSTNLSITVSRWSCFGAQWGTFISSLDYGNDVEVSGGIVVDGRNATTLQLTVTDSSMLGVGSSALSSSITTGPNTFVFNTTSILSLPGAAILIQLSLCSAACNVLVARNSTIGAAGTLARIQTTSIAGSAAYGVLLQVGVPQLGSVGVWTTTPSPTTPIQCTDSEQDPSILITTNSVIGARGGAFIQGASTTNGGAIVISAIGNTSSLCSRLPLLTISDQSVVGAVDAASSVTRPAATDSSGVVALFMDRAKLLVTTGSIIGASNGASVRSEVGSGISFALGTATVAKIVVRDFGVIGALGPSSLVRGGDYGILVQCITTGNGSTTITVQGNSTLGASAGGMIQFITMSGIRVAYEVPNDDLVVAMLGVTDSSVVGVSAGGTINGPGGGVVIAEIAYLQIASNSTIGATGANSTFDVMTYVVYIARGAYGFAMDITIAEDSVVGVRRGAQVPQPVLSIAVVGVSGPVLTSRPHTSRIVVANNSCIGTQDAGTYVNVYEVSRVGFSTLPNVSILVSNTSVIGVRRGAFVLVKLNIATVLYSYTQGGSLNVTGNSVVGIECSDNIVFTGLLANGYSETYGPTSLWGTNSVNFSASIQQGSVLGLRSLGGSLRVINNLDVSNITAFNFFGMYMENSVIRVATGSTVGWDVCSTVCSKQLPQPNQPSSSPTEAWVGIISAVLWTISSSSNSVIDVSGNGTTIGMVVSSTNMCPSITTTIPFNVSLGLPVVSLDLSNTTHTILTVTEAGAFIGIRFSDVTLVGVYDEQTIIAPSLVVFVTADSSMGAQVDVRDGGMIGLYRSHMRIDTRGTPMSTSYVGVVVVSIQSCRDCNVTVKGAGSVLGLVSSNITRSSAAMAASQPSLARVVAINLWTPTTAYVIVNATLGTSGGGGDVVGGRTLLGLWDTHIGPDVIDATTFNLNSYFVAVQGPLFSRSQFALYITGPLGMVGAYRCNLWMPVSRASAVLLIQAPLTLSLGARLAVVESNITFAYRSTSTRGHVLLFQTPVEQTVTFTDTRSAINVSLNSIEAIVLNNASTNNESVCNVVGMSGYSVSAPHNYPTSPHASMTRTIQWVCCPPLCRNGW